LLNRFDISTGIPKTFIDTSTGEIFHLNMNTRKYKTIFNIGFHDMCPIESEKGIQTILKSELCKSPIFKKKNILKSKYFINMKFIKSSCWDFLKQGISSGIYVN
jgi:hypothetical protein